MELNGKMHSLVKKAQSFDIKAANVSAENLVPLRKHFSTDDSNTRLDASVMDSNLATNHQRLLAWVEQVRKQCKPSKVYWCTGKQEEYDTLCEELVKSGTFTRLKESATRGKNCFLAR